MPSPSSSRCSCACNVARRHENARKRGRESRLAPGPRPRMFLASGLAAVELHREQFRGADGAIGELYRDPAGDAQVGYAGQQLLDRDFDLDPREMHPEAAVDADAEGDVRVLLTVEPKL